MGFTFPRSFLAIAVATSMLLLVPNSFSAAPEADEFRTQRTVWALGDIANGPGAEVVAETRVLGGESITTKGIWTVNLPARWDLRAVSVPDNRTVWSLEIPPRSFWVFVPDIDGDRIRDLVIQTQEEDRDVNSDGQLVGPYSHSYVEAYRLRFLSSKTGSTLFERDLTYENHEAGSDFAVHADRTQTYYESHVLPAPNDSGAGLVFLHTVDGTRDETVWLPMVGYAYEARPFYQATFDRVDLRGNRLWTATVNFSDGYGAIVSTKDYDGDGVDDYLLSSRQLDRPDSLGTLKPQEGTVGATLLNGANGKELWSYRTAKFVGEGGAQPAGSVGEGQGVLVQLHTAGEEPLSPWGTRSVLLDAATGSVLREEFQADRFVTSKEFADVDRDGFSELLSEIAVIENVPTGYERRGRPTVGVYDQQGNQVWSLGEGRLDALGRSWHFTAGDLNGDSVPDSLRPSESPDGKSEVQAISGADGNRLWGRSFVWVVDRWTVVDDVNGDHGKDVVWMHFDLNESAQERFWENGANLSEYPGWLMLLDGTTGDVLWNATLHQPMVDDVFAGFIWSQAEASADITGDSRPDLVFSTEPTFCEGMEGTEPECTTPPLNYALVIDGRNGTGAWAHGRWPSGLLRASITASADDSSKTEDGDVSAGPTDSTSGPQGSIKADAKHVVPGTSFGLAALTCAGIILWRRKRRINSERV